MAQEVDDGTQTRIAVLGADGSGIDQNDLGRSQSDRLVQPGRIVVEEGDRAIQPTVERIGQLEVAGEAEQDAIGHRNRAYTAPALQ